MATYTFKNKDNGEIFEKKMSMMEIDSFKKDNPNLEIVHLPPNFISGHNLKPDPAFRSLLKNIKKASGKNSTINTF